MDGVLIELGPERGAVSWDRPARRACGGRRPARWPLAAALTLLVLCSVGGATAPTSALTRLGGLDVPAGSDFRVAGDLLLVAEPAGILSAYDLGGPRRAPVRRWSAPLRPAASYAVEAAGDLLLVAEVEGGGRTTATTARSADTGTVRWRRPGRVRAAGDGTTGLAVTEVRSASDGGRRVEGAVHGVDLADGATRWSVPVPSTAVVQPVPGVPARVLLVQDSGRAELHDLRGGTLVGAVALPPADYAPDNPLVLGDRLVLRHPEAGGSSVTGYDLPALVARWSRTGLPARVDLRPCGPLVCLDDGSGLRAVDPGGGAQRWRAPQRRGWREVPASGRADPVLTWAYPGGTGVATGSGADFRLLGTVAAGADECRAGPRVLVCATGAGRLAAWRLP